MSHIITVVGVVTLFNVFLVLGLMYVASFTALDKANGTRGIK